MSLRLAKLAASLQHKKYRNREQLFVAEGEKLVLDLLHTFEVKHLLCSEDWAFQHPNLNTTIVSDSLMRKASGMTHPTPILGIFQVPDKKAFNTDELPALVLDSLQDPGNLGTIIRTAAWFGIRHIVCSPETADIYNPKVVQATMGALAMVQIHYKPLQAFIEELSQQNITVVGTFLEGKNIYNTQIPQKSVVVIGNEGHGISESIRPLISLPVHIPSFATNTPESLNASVSTAIVCSEIARTTQN